MSFQINNYIYRCIECQYKFQKRSSLGKIKCPKCKKREAYMQGSVNRVQDSGSHSSGMSEKQILEHISTPFWLLAGQKPKPAEARQLDYMKKRNLTFTDIRRMEATKATNRGAYEQFLNYRNGKGESAKYEKSH